MAFELVLFELAGRELASLRAFDRRRILEEAEQQLTHEPEVETKRRKPLKNVMAIFDFDEPLWELKVGEYRVFYDVNRRAMRVNVRSVRYKPPEKTTEDVLNETSNP